MGSDIPDVNAAVLDAAFLVLDSHQLVLGPACDGGFYLIGATAAPSNFLQARSGDCCCRGRAAAALLSPFCRQLLERGVHVTAGHCAESCACRASHGAQTALRMTRWHTPRHWA